MKEPEERVELCVTLSWKHVVAVSILETKQVQVLIPELHKTGPNNGPLWKRGGFTRPMSQTMRWLVRHMRLLSEDTGVVNDCWGWVSVV